MTAIIEAAIELKSMFGWLIGSFGVFLVGDVIPQSVSPWWADWVLSMTLALVPVVMLYMQIKKNKNKKNEKD